MGFLKDCQFTAFKVPLSTAPANFVQGRNTLPEAWWDIRGSEYIAYYRFLEANVTLEQTHFQKVPRFPFLWDKDSTPQWGMLLTAPYPKVQDPLSFLCLRCVYM